MTKEDLNKLATIEDLQKLYLKIKGDILELMNQNKKEFYTPKEYQLKTGIPYRTIIRYCNDGKLQALQKVFGGGWLIYHTEIDRLILEAKNNKYD